MLWLVVYNGANYLASLHSQVPTCGMAWERIWPFVPELIVVYWSIELLFIPAPLFCGTREALRAYVRRVTFCLLVAGFFFVAWPLRLPWPHPPVTGWVAPFFSSLHHFNNDYNCAPSLHIALICCLWPVYVTPLRGPARALAAAWFALGWLSTLLCGQHMLMDVMTGQLLGMLALRLFRQAHPAGRPAGTARSPA